MATKSDLVEAVANITGVSKAKADRTVNAVFTTITDILAKVVDVRLSGFGKFIVGKRAARKGRNPQTVDAVGIGARTHAKVRVGESLKRAVNRNRKGSNCSLADTRRMPPTKCPEPD